MFDQLFEQEMEDTRPLLTVKQVSRILSVSPSMVYKEIALWHLPCVRVGKSIRVRPEDLEAYIETNLNGALN